MVQDLISDDAHHLEALLARDGVDNHVPMYTNKVLAIEDSIFVLAGGIDDLDGKVRVLVPNHFAKRVLDGWVVGVDEVAVDVLDGQGAFA